MRNQNRCLYLPGLNDVCLKNDWRGEIFALKRGCWERVAYVYGRTLEEMRERKHFLVECLENSKEKP